MIKYLFLLFFVAAYHRTFTAPLDPPDTFPENGVFWQITDIHWDTFYSLDGDPQKMCHSNSSHPDTAADLLQDHKELSQQGLNEHNGLYGNYLCDAPWRLVKATLDAMMSVKQDPDFILWTGDMSPHTRDPAPHFDIIFKMLKNVTLELKSRFSSSVPILPVLGNHDAYPKDDFPDCPQPFYERYLEEGGWRNVMTASQRLSFARGGYYTHQLPSGLTVAVLNTNLYYMGNKKGIGDPDPCAQFQWLKEVFAQARIKNRKVLVTGHSPPGFFERMPVIPFFNDSYNDYYLDVMRENYDVIHSHVYGHLHTDSFRLYDGNAEGIGSVGFLAPSVTPWKASPIYGGTAINPSLRLYLYDLQSVLDYTQYHLNLTKANELNETAKFSVLLDPGQQSSSTQQPRTEPKSGSVSGGRELLSLPCDNSCSSSSCRTCHLSNDGDIENIEQGVLNAAVAHSEVDHRVTFVGHSDRLQWEVFYVARKAYSLSRLDAKNLESLYWRLHSDAELFNIYYLRNSAGVDNGVCGSTCRRSQLCSVRYSKVRDVFKCIAINKIDFAELLKKTFSQYNASEYDKYFEADRRLDGDESTTERPHQTAGMSTVRHHEATSDVGDTVIKFISPLYVVTGLSLLLLTLSAWLLTSRYCRRRRLRLFGSSYEPLYGSCD